VLIFDSEMFPEGDRAEALSAAFSGMEAPQTVTFSASRPVRHRMEIFELGSGIHLLRNMGAPIHVVRSARHVRLGTRDEMALYVQSRGEALLTVGGGMSSWKPGQLGAVDVTRPYALRQISPCDNNVLLIEFGRLGVPVDLIRAAIPLIGSSPLYRLLREHLLHLAVDLPADGAVMTGQATADLIAALIASVHDHSRGREVLNATEPVRIAAYVDQHLGDPDLTTGQIAAAHGMPARELTAAWRRAHDATPADWIAQRRLERARQLLLDPALARASMADIAYACGFRDAAGFGQRFRVAYGSSPRDFRRPRTGRADPNVRGSRADLGQRSPRAG
jgi:AraC family transcriptional regulator, positive regulator of tynA and feaB